MNVFCDMDGVLVDLVKGFKDHCGYCITEVNHLKDELVWKDALIADKFWENLPKMSEADLLIAHLKERIPKEKLFVLSAKMHLFDLCEWEKINWINNHAPIFNADNIKIVRRSQKREYAYDITHNCSNILIDDYEKNIKEWEHAGGIGIHHINLESTLDKLSDFY